jgi:enoyl-CoA hydratase/carnithine racemase
MRQRVPEVDVLYRSADFVEGPKAFAEKRPPKWQGA